jgi:transcriptional regulator with XRE-family HTH domain
MPAVKGRQIRERRQGLGTKLGPFAELARLKYKTLANIESGGQAAVSIEIVNRIVSAFHALGDEEVSAEDLLADRTPAEPAGAAA